jgi:hypothetical protein
LGMRLSTDYFCLTELLDNKCLQMAVKHKLMI